MEGDSESNYAYYALHKLKILPNEYNVMNRREKAFIMAAIDIKIENEKKQAAKVKK